MTGETPMDGGYSDPPGRFLLRVPAPDPADCPHGCRKPIAYPGSIWQCGTCGRVYERTEHEMTTGVTDRWRQLRGRRLRKVWRTLDLDEPLT